MLRRIAPAVLAGLLVPGAALASDPDSRPPDFVSLTFENDFFVGFDRHYTNGVQLAFAVDASRLPAGLRALPPYSWSADPQVVVAIGQRIYTPADTDRDPPDPRDRPYAGWLYAMTEVRTATGRVVDHVTLGVGVVGPASLARQTQDGVHHLLGEAASRGWDSQIHDEPTLMAGFERAWPAIAQAVVGGDRVDLSLRSGAMLGNALTYASAGLVARYGRHLPSDLPVTSISLGPPRDGYRGAAEFGWYAWAGVDARAVAWNVFLDGNTFRASPSVDRRPFGYDVQLGVAAAWPSMRLGFTVVERGREFYGQDKPDRFAQVTASYAF